MLHISVHSPWRIVFILNFIGFDRANEHPQGFVEQEMAKRKPRSQQEVNFTIDNFYEFIKSNLYNLTKKTSYPERSWSVDI